MTRMIGDQVVARSDQGGVKEVKGHGFELIDSLFAIFTFTLLGRSITSSLLDRNWRLSMMGTTKAKISKKVEVDFAAKRKAARDQKHKDFEDMIARRRKDLTDEEEIEEPLLA